MHRLTGCNFLEKSGRKPTAELSELHGPPHTHTHIESSTTSHRFILLSFVLVENYHGGNGWKKEKEISGFVQEM